MLGLLAVTFDELEDLIEYNLDGNAGPALRALDMSKNLVTFLFVIPHWNVRYWGHVMRPNQVDLCVHTMADFEMFRRFSYPRLWLLLLS